MTFVYLFYFLLFIFLSHKNFKLALGIFIISLPTYLIRFNIGVLPTNLLEVSFLAILVIWLLKYAKQDTSLILKIIKQYKLLFILIGAFFLSSIVSIFVSGNYYEALGIWRAYFLEPIILFFIILGQSQNIKIKNLILFLSLSVVSVSIYAVLQKIFGFGLDENRRVLSFFTSPNAVSLYLAPIVMIMLSLFFLTKSKYQSSVINFNKYKKIHLFTGITILLLASLVIVLTKSQGAWIAIFAGLVVFFGLIGYKKIITTAIIVSILAVFLLPSLRSAVTFQDSASNNRLILWGQSRDYLLSSPTNFIFGSGLRQFYNKIQKPTHDWTIIYRHIYPHNIFLNFWTEIGLLGMMSFTGLLLYLLHLSLKIRKKDLVIGSGLFSVLVVIIIHGLVDVPYFKNDLAFLFWIIVSIVLLSSYNIKNISKQI